MATVALSGIITPTNVVTATSTTTLTNKTLTGAVMNGTLGATTPSTVVATTVQASTTMGVGGATPSASGSGISFPATQSASSDANTLDDYEEGTWTPTDGSGAGLTFTSVYGSYTKIGRTVVATFRLTYPSTSSTAAGAISGLPFVTGGQSGVGATAGGGFINYQQTNTSAIYLTLDASGGTKASWYTTGGATILNVTFTGALMAATIVYQTT